MFYEAVDSAKLNLLLDGGVSTNSVVKQFVLLNCWQVKS